MKLMKIINCALYVQPRYIVNVVIAEHNEQRPSAIILCTILQL